MDVAISSVACEPDDMEDAIGLASILAYPECLSNGICASKISVGKVFVHDRHWR